MDDGKRTPVSLQQMETTPVRKSSITHAPIPAPNVDEMAPQSISFIGNPDKEISEGNFRLVDQDLWYAFIEKSWFNSIK